jgi:hypothetical protein
MREPSRVRVSGTILIGIGLYVGVSAVLALADHSAPDGSPAGVALTSACVAGARAGEASLARPLWWPC